MRHMEVLDDMMGRSYLGDLSSLEGYSALKMLKNRYTDMIKKYEETLGFILRDTKPTSKKTQKVQENWALEMQRTLAKTTAAAAAAKTTQLAKKEESKPKLPFGIGGKEKEKEKNDKPDSSGEWVSLEPMSLFIGQKNRGLAEIYFDTINILRENLNKINSAISICSALRTKAATAGSTSLVVSFVNDVPTKVMLKPLRDGVTKKYTMAFSFAVPAMPMTASRSLVVK